MKDDGVDYFEECRESENSQNNDDGRGLYLLGAGPRDPFHLVAQFADVILCSLGPLFESF
jgi:hypothetical protein